ncbi:MAG: 50S ribosomal protein L19 [Candidatus Cloacimonetes bacterium 4572_55]|nr:MAG: 50S ribosomal protein L19 [Candidatus Cloacimonetes bacterium 4572_55]
MSSVIQEIEKESLRHEFPDFKSGDTVRVKVKVREGEKERVQAFQGVVIQKKGSGISSTFTVRKISGGYGVERIFPYHSPWIQGVELVRRGKVRRARIYYFRKLRGKAARIKQLRLR